MLLLLILALPLLQSRPVQTWLAREVVAPYLSKELQTRVEIGSLYLRFNLVDAFSLRFRNVLLREVYVADRAQDTLLYAPKLLMSIREFDLDKSSFRLSEASISGARVYLKTLPEDRNNVVWGKSSSVR